LKSLAQSLSIDEVTKTFLLTSSKVLPDAVFHSIHPLADLPMTAMVAVMGLENKYLSLCNKTVLPHL
jgi:ABC-type spermidine/putrescine transport system permease subunit II